MERFVSGGAGENFRKRNIQPEINEETHNFSQEAVQNNSTGASEQSTNQDGNIASISVTVGKSELEQILKQMTFTRSETQHLITLLHSRTIEESPTSLTRLEASTSGSLKRHKYGDERDNLHASISSSRVSEEKIASPAEVSNAYKGSTIATVLIKTPMASPQHPATMENLPEELLVNIFTRLLSKQLAQMRSVSKPWNALLSQPSFVKSHLLHSIHNNDQILLVFYHDVCISDSKPFTAHLSRSPHLQLTEFNKLLPVDPISGLTNTIRIIGAVNGLICSSYDDGAVIHVWNPSLSAVSTLPKYPMPFRHAYEVNLRFGFDPKTNDYKVVMVIRAHRKEWLQVGLYSMRKGYWELINERFPSHINRIYNRDRVCLDGHDGRLHWLCLDKTYKKTIVAFDLGSHTFHEMLLPHSVTGTNWDGVLGVFARKLCVMMTDLTDKYLLAREVWVMEEYGVAESWVKRHVTQFIARTSPSGFTSKNELIIDENGGRVLYDLNANEAKVFDVSFSCNRKRHYPLKFVEYVDSLVWIEPGAGEN